MNVGCRARRACSVCVMLGTATVMAAAAPRRVPVARGVVDISMSVASAARAAANALCRLQNKRVASRGHRGDRGKCRGRARAMLHASLHEFAAPYMLVSARAAVFHRVFALSCFVKRRRRVASVKSCVRCSCDARRCVVRFYVLTATSATAFTLTLLNERPTRMPPHSRNVMSQMKRRRRLFENRTAKRTARRGHE